MKGSIVIVISSLILVFFLGIANATEWEIIQITNNDYEDMYASVYENRIVWARHQVINQTEVPMGIFYYDGTNTHQLSSEGGFPDIYGNTIVWSQSDDPETIPNEGGLYLHDDSGTRKITNGGGYPSIYENTIYFMRNDKIYGYDISSSNEFQASGDYGKFHHPSYWGSLAYEWEWVEYGNLKDGIVHGGSVYDTGIYDRTPSAYHGQVAWAANSPLYAGSGIYYSNGGSPQRIYEGIAGRPSLFDGRIAYTADGNLLLYDGVSTTTIATINANRLCLFEEEIAFDANDGNDHEIYLARPIPENEPPIADAGPDQDVDADSACTATVTLDGSGSTDPDSTLGTNDDIVSFEWFENSTSIGTGELLDYTFPLGVHTITFIVTDTAGATASDGVVITVVDTTPPEISVSVSPDTLWPPNHKMVLCTPTITVSDNCDLNPTVQLVSVTSNEADDADDILINNGDIYLRAERSGHGDGRVYTITYEAIDDSGNSAPAKSTVTVPHNQ